MARPHIDYLQSQSLPWQASPWPFLPGCHVKILSRDADTGATSLLVRYPSGWEAPAPGFLATSEELLVLDGLLELDGRRCGQDAYGWFPAGWRHATRAAPDGAVALTFFDADPLCSSAPAGGGPALESRLVDSFDLPWSAAAPGLVTGSDAHRCKLLRGSPGGGSATLLLSTAAHLHPPRWQGPQEIHACAEELYLLAGDLLSPIGQLAAGAYCWLPSRVAHGPYGSRGGSLALMRIHGAPFTTEFTDHELALERTPPYQPVLPPALRALTVRPWRPQRY